MTAYLQLLPDPVRDAARTLAATVATVAMVATSGAAANEVAADAVAAKTVDVKTVASTAAAGVQQTETQQPITQRPDRKQKPQPLPITDRVTLGPAPTGSDAAALVAQNGLFIDLRTDQDLKEKGYVPTLGLHRQRLPIAELADADATSATLRDMLERAGDRPVWIGCNSGNRAALAWAVLQVQDGTTPADALAAVDRLATYEPLREAILKR